MTDTPRKKPQRRPQISLSEDVYAELQKIAEIWALPNADAVVPIMLKRFGRIMHDGIPDFVVNMNPAPPFPPTENKVVTFPASQGIKRDANPPTDPPSPGNAFLELDF